MTAIARFVKNVRLGQNYEESWRKSDFTCELLQGLKGNNFGARDDLLPVFARLANQGRFWRMDDHIEDRVGSLDKIWYARSQL